MALTIHVAADFGFCFTSFPTCLPSIALAQGHRDHVLFYSPLSSLHPDRLKNHGWCAMVDNTSAMLSPVSRAGEHQSSPFPPTPLFWGILIKTVICPFLPLPSPKSRKSRGDHKKTIQNKIRSAEMGGSQGSSANHLREFDTFNFL